MKYFLFTLLLFCCCGAYAQNLVPNPSFEDMLHCPTGTDEIEAASSWLNFGNSPDYFNTCTPIIDGVGGVPSNYGFAYQYPHTGNGMAGIVTWENPYTGPDGSNYREFIGTHLLSSLQPGQKYYLSFYINCSGIYSNYLMFATNKIGLRFFTTPFDSSHHAPIDNFAHLYTDSIFSDTVSWFRLSGSFIADSAYNYVCIANFFDDAHTDTLAIGNKPYGGEVAYYFIDDVCVTTDSLYNEEWTLTQNISKPETNIRIFPNPTTGIVNVKSAEAIETIEIVNYLGKVYKTINRNNCTYCSLNVGELAGGIYFIRIKTKDEINTSIIDLIK